MDLLHSLQKECLKSSTLKKGRYVYQKGLWLATPFALNFCGEIVNALSFKGLQKLVSPVVCPEQKPCILRHKTQHLQIQLVYRVRRI